MSEKPAFLIIDDDKTDRYILKRRIRSIGEDRIIFEKENGKEALEFLEAHEENRKKCPEFPPILIFLDINMPLINGFEFLSRFSEIRSEISMETSVVMMFTSSTQTEEEKKAHAFEFVKGYLPKSGFSDEELRTKIDTCLGA